MGLLSFVKSAGAKLFGNDEEEKAIEQELAAKAQRENLEKLKKARALRNRLDRMALDIENLEIEVSDDGTVVLRGTAKNQATAEKAALTVGNVNGVEAVDNQLEVSNPEPEAQFHTVVSGDNLSKIAKQYYGSARKYPVIFEANKPMLTDPDKIYPGQVLRIPAIED